MHADMGPDQKVLNYGDIVLRASDLVLLRGQDWLNDVRTLVCLCFDPACDHEGML